jgi:beta-glucanase (GH16 family)
MGGPTVWTDKKALEWRVADDFHTYGCEWNAEGLKFYADGALVRSATVAEIEAERTADAGPNAWILTKPLYIWVDSETFPWHGLPAMEDLPVDFEIDYIRIWQEN